ncbi:nucleotidyl transferase AbiEii/AbiGii toxin family protein [Patescibacteria group bacterium]|nr:nucleotidyl transferase AbiEii/AbiGii toxin family protein [Patescibacteria group bacterium]MBU3923081.1 nucleotidyl transferase AbiEii/AbiGii toxin family protein [Patescibacteria group bacterium]
MTLNISEHENILLQILKDIYSDTTISPFLGFKGGTAAYLFYNLDRFSVDIDFDLLDETKEEIVFLKIKKIIESYGQIKETKKKRFNLFFLVSYKKEFQNVKIEVNRRLFGSQYELRTHLGISMLVMKKEDMFAHKLMAMNERIGKANRDIYDVWFFLRNNWSVNRKIVEDRSKMTFGDFLKKSITALEELEDSNILSDMGELLNKKQKDWVKSNLKKDTVFLLKLMLDDERK